ncbi:uncharacterized protein MONBRDRAFT_10526 [Monosiga brevicollis MX1]|uniref:Uncharacterized protein n=1 Tax=Monosiga brevicollis TaxID=81824 RepID=A9V6M1_MONBE|nr:uncharacterized protein MONBRDRAFT_10526 [Monosiga brevicollis MX1]EDQ86832.1 predicted protein [Monosiga brevicollis MX1]|eukprot:XP_001748377.1 hypothetical protein [Monosiga brevicollis MX1]
MAMTGMLDRLRGAVQRLVQRLDAAACEEVQQVILQIPPPALAALAEHICMPLRVVIAGKQAKEKDVIAALQALGILFRHGGQAIPLPLALQHFQILGLVLAGRGVAVSIADDVALAIVQATEALVFSRSDIMAPLCSDQYLPALGQLVAELGTVLENTQRSSAVRAAAGELLLHLYEGAARRDTGVATFMVPGLLSLVTKVLRRIVHGAAPVAVVGLRLLTAILCHAVADNNLPPDTSPLDDLRELAETVRDTADRSTDSSDQLSDDPVVASETSSADQPYSLRQTPDAAWWGRTVPMVEHLNQQLFHTVVLHQAASVREATARCCCLAALRCARALPACVPSWIDTLVLLSSDDAQTIASLAQTCLAALHTNRLTSVITALLRERLHQLVLQHQAWTEDAFQRHLRRLNAYLRILPATTPVFADADTAGRVLRACVAALRLDVDQCLAIVNQHAAPDQEHVVVDDVLGTAQRMRRVYRQFHLTTTADLMDEFLRLGMARGLGLHLEDALDAERVILHERPEWLLLVQGALSTPDTDSFAAAHSPSTDIPGQSNLPSAPKSSPWQGSVAQSWKHLTASRPPSTSSRNSDAGTGFMPQQRSLADLALAMCTDGDLLDAARSWASGKALQPVTPAHSNNAKDAPSTAHRVARVTVFTCLLLETVGQAAQVLQRALRERLMHLMFMLLLHTGLPETAVNSSAQWAMVQVAHACGYTDAAALLSDNVDYLINDITLRIRVLVAVERWSPRLPQDSLHVGVDGLRTAEPTIDAPDPNDAHAQDPPPPPHAMLVVEALRRIKHLLGNSNDQERLILLQALTAGVGVLAPFENELLPIVAQIWPILQLREQHGALLAEPSDFANRLNGPRHRLVAKILGVFADMWNNLTPSVADTRLLCRAAVQYLDNRLDADLQALALTLIERLATVSADTVWYETSRCCGPKELLRDDTTVIADKSDHWYYAAQFPAPNPHYAVNATTVFALLEQADPVVV